MKYRPTNDKCAVCNYDLSALDGDVIECPKCHTQYELVNRKIDNSNTAVGISDCQHRRQLFVAGSRWSGSDWYGHYDVMLCADCGQFTVFGSENGQHYKLTFELVSDEQVKAAGRYARLLDLEESGEYHVGRGLLTESEGQT